MGYLDDLKKKAEAERAKHTVDTSALDRNTLLADAACNTAFRYLASMCQQLNVIQPVSKGVYRFDAKNTFRHLKMSNFRCDARQKRLRDSEVYDHISLAFDIKSGQRVTIAKDFPPEMEKLEARLAQCGTRYYSENRNDPQTGRFMERRYDFTADFNGAVRITAEHDTAWIGFNVRNLEGFETVTVRFPAFEVGNQRLDELAKWIVGEPNAFLSGGQDMRRVEI